MKIKVGEFVRLARNQGINKIIDEDDDGFLILDEMIADEYGDECFEISLQDVDKEIIKHSFNIIDLIEVGDIVEYQVNSLSELKVGRVKSYRDARSNKEYLGVEGFDITKIYIKSILTNKQFEENCYKLL